MPALLPLLIALQAVPAETIGPRECPVWEREAQLASVLATRRPGAVAALLDADVMVLSAATPVLRGRGAVLERWPKPALRIVRHPQAVASVGSDDLAWVRGEAVVGEGASRRIAPYRTLWRKRADGQWRLAIDDMDAPATATPERIAALEAAPARHCVED